MNGEFVQRAINRFFLTGSLAAETEAEKWVRDSFNDAGKSYGQVEAAEV